MPCHRGASLTCTVESGTLHELPGSSGRAAYPCLLDFIPIL